MSKRITPRTMDEWIGFRIEMTYLLTSADIESLLNTALAPEVVLQGLMQMKRNDQLTTLAFEFRDHIEMSMSAAARTGLIIPHLHTAIACALLEYTVLGGPGASYGSDYPAGMLLLAYHAADVPNESIDTVLSTKRNKQIERIRGRRVKQDAANPLGRALRSLLNDSNNYVTSLLRISPIISDVFSGVIGSTIDLDDVEFQVRYEMLGDDWYPAPRTLLWERIADLLTRLKHRQ